MKNGLESLPEASGKCDRNRNRRPAALKGDLTTAAERDFSSLPGANSRLARLTETAKAYARAARSENTARAYDSDWRQFASWLRRNGFNEVPPDPQTVGLHLAAQAEAGVSVATIERRLSGICWRYRQLGEPLDARDRHISTVLAGVRRQHGRPPVQKAAIFADELLAMLATLEMDLRGLRDRAILALGAATACAALTRHREDSAALRDAEHLSPNAGGNAPTSPAGRVHRLWRGFAARPAGFDQQNLRRAADLLELPRDLDFEALAEALRRLFQGEENPLAAAARAGSTTTRMLDGAPRAETEILALWLSDLMLARKLGWDAPIALLATTIARPSSRSAGRRPRPGDADWPLHCATAVALAAREAHGLAADLSRRSAKLLSVAPKLRAKGASRVIEMLLADDAVSPATAAKAARLSDRASRRLFDRLVELGVVRELSGRPSFRLYGL